MAFTFKESSSYLFNKDDQEYIFNKKKLINSSAVQLCLKNHYIYIYWKLYNTHLEIQFAPTLTDFAIFKINLPKNTTDNIQFKEDKDGKLIYMYLLSNDGTIFKYSINIKSKEIDLQSQYIIRNIQKPQFLFFKAIDQNNFIITTNLNEIILIKKLKDESILEKKQSLSSSFLRNFSKLIINTSEEYIQDISYIKFNNTYFIVVLFNNILYIMNENLKFIFNKELMKPISSKSQKFLSIYDIYIDEHYEYISFKLCILLGEEFHLFKMIIDQNENVNLIDDGVVLPVIELNSNNDLKKSFINTFQIAYLNNHYILWVDQRDLNNKSIIKYLYLSDNNTLQDSLEGFCPEIWLPLITNNIICNTDNINKKKLSSHDNIRFNPKVKETINSVNEHDDVFPRSLSSLSLSNFSLLSDINDIPSMPSNENNTNDNIDEKDSIELVKEYYMNYIFNINKFSLSVLYYSLMRYSEEADISAFIDQLELKHIGLNYIKKCIINCIDEKINSNVIGNDRNCVEKEYKKFLFYCIMEYESENKFVSFLQYSQDSVMKTTIPLFILIKKAYITTINLCDTSEIFYNALTNKNCMMELQYFFSNINLNKKNSYHNISSSITCFLSAIDQLYRNQSLSKNFNVKKSNDGLKNPTLNIQQITRDIIYGICKSSLQLENLVENIYYDYLADNKRFLKKIRKLKDIKGCIEYIFDILSDRNEQTLPLENEIQNNKYHRDKISKNYITYLTQLISVNVKEVINARYYLCFHLFIVLIAFYILDKQNSLNKGSTEFELNKVSLFKPEFGHFEYRNYLYRCKSYLHALIILKWASEYSDIDDVSMNANNQIMELKIFKNMNITNFSKSGSKKDIVAFNSINTTNNINNSNNDSINNNNINNNNSNNNDIVMNIEKIKFILSYFKINKINIDEKIDHTILSHNNDSILFRLLYSSILSLIKIKGIDDDENINESNLFNPKSPISNSSNSLTHVNYFSLYPSELAKHSISLIDIIYDYSHRYLCSINLSWYSKENIISSTLILFVIQIIQHSSKAYQYLRELLPSINSSCLFLLQGIISLVSNDIDSSEDYFEKAGSAFVANTVDSSIYTFLPLTIKNAYQYYQYIMNLYQNIGLTYKQIEKFAKLSLLYMKDDLNNNEISDDLKLVIFKCLINTLNFEEAFLIIHNIADIERKKQLLEEFIIKICEYDQTLLYKFTFSGHQNEIENILFYRTTITSNPLSLPNYSKILYSYLIYNGSFRKAASVMYNYSQQLYKCCKSDMMENSLKSLLVEQSKALLITINSLSLVDKKNQYITIRQETKGGEVVKNVTLLDIRKEYYLSLSKLELSKNHRESETSILSLDPVDAVTLYISLGKYDTAISFSLLYGFDLSIIFQNILLQYVKSSFMIINSDSNYITDYFNKVLSGKKGKLIRNEGKEEKKEKSLASLNLPKQLFMQDNNENNTTIYNYKINQKSKEPEKESQLATSLLSEHSSSSSIDKKLHPNQKKASGIMNSSIDFCELLKKFLSLHDSSTNYYRYHKVVIEKFLETCITSEVPEWLIQPFMDQFSGDLIRIFIKYNRINEAAQFTLKILNNIDKTNKDNNKKWFPYTVLDQLICIMEERSQKDINDKKIFNSYINSIKELIRIKNL